ncbi:MAG: hypothetical protein WD002_14825 [Pseudomonadales bacterium]
MKTNKIVQNTLVFIAILFGALTIIAGSRVLGGSDPGYVVYKPLVIYNTVMGFAYVATGVIAWRNLFIARAMGGTIFSLNTIVFLVIIYLYRTGSSVAIDSVQAMTLRTVVWLALFTGFVWLNHKARPAGTGQN